MTVFCKYGPGQRVVSVDDDSLAGVVQEVLITINRSGEKVVEYNVFWDTGGHDDLEEDQVRGSQ